MTSAGRRCKPGYSAIHICEVSDPFVVGSGRFEGAVGHIRSGRRPLAHIGCRSIRPLFQVGWTSRVRRLSGLANPCGSFRLLTPLVLAD